MSEHNYKFNIAMSCGGCSGAVERVLKKLEGKPPSTTAGKTGELTHYRRQVVQRLSRNPDRRYCCRGVPHLRNRPREDQEDRQDRQVWRGRWCSQGCLRAGRAFEPSLYNLFVFCQQWIPPFVAAEPLALLQLPACIMQAILHRNVLGTTKINIYPLLLHIVCAFDVTDTTRSAHAKPALLHWQSYIRYMEDGHPQLG
jgi:hypothetical protein